MNSSGLVIIGSGPAGVSAAETFRKHDQDSAVRIMTADHDLPYERPPLSKDFLRGDTDDVALHPRSWFEKRSIELHVADIEAIDVADHAIVVDGLRMPYGALILACGSAPNPLPVPGGEHALSLRSLSDARRLREAAGAAQSAVVVGAGFIGCEAAASLAKRGIDVTLVAPDDVPQVKRLGAEAGHRLKELVEQAGARYVGGVSVEALERDGVRLNDGRVLGCELILAATGVKPQSDLGRAAGLHLEQSRIAVDAAMRTKADDVFAAGDVALAHNASAGRHIAVEHWQDAMDHGEIAGAGAAGQSANWNAVPGFWTTIGDATVKYHAWGDGYEVSRLVEHEDGFTVWYETEGATVGVLTCDADEDYDLGERLITSSQPAPGSSKLR